MLLLSLVYEQIIGHDIRSSTALCNSHQNDNIQFTKRDSYLNYIATCICMRFNFLRLFHVIYVSQLYCIFLSHSIHIHNDNHDSGNILSVRLYYSLMIIGRRKCLADQLSSKVLFSFTTALVQQFHLSFPEPTPSLEAIKWYNRKAQLFQIIAKQSEI